ncbi:MAG TPA: alpha/beta hydrolase, partial [Ktedonobacterales bacterium]|nr:alpha/beta hydrolase [Ktedonobacterales bacterium]
ATTQPVKPTTPGAQRGTVRSIHYTLRYLAQNIERGPRGAIVLLHDLPGGAFVWESALPQLAETGRAVYAFDMLGYGQSDHPWPSDTTIWGHADCLLYAFQALGLHEITLVGFGVGGSVAQTLATRLFQDGVAKLALINTYAYTHAFAPNWPLPEMEKHQDPELAHTISVEQTQSELRQALPLGAAKGLSGARVDTYASEWNSVTGKFLLMQHVRSMIPLYSNSVASDVTKLRIPMLVIWGERDEVTPLTLGQRLARETSDARLEVVSGAGHMILDDAPDQVARLLAEFARK